MQDVTVANLQDYRVQSKDSHLPPLLNVMYCVRVSLWTVKIFLAQRGQSLFISGQVLYLYVPNNQNINKKTKRVALPPTFS